MHMQKNIYHTVYNRLLADISISSRVQICAPDDLGDEWYLVKGPMLDKQILGYLEGWNQEVDIPEWLMPLWLSFLKDKNPTTLGYIRQLLVFCYKIEFEPKPQQLNETIEGFTFVEESVKLWNISVLGNCASSGRDSGKCSGFNTCGASDQSGEDTKKCIFSRQSHIAFLSTAKRLISRVIANVDLKNIVPHHGPGAVFPPRKPWKKTKFSTCYTSIDRYYPWSEFFQFGLSSGLYEPLTDDTPTSDEIVSRLVAVPKDSRGPRLICVHPAEAIWIQQGQRRVLEDAITSHWLTRESIRFDDQTVNGAMALSSSKTRALCTLDLKEASDRIGINLVRYLFGEEFYDILSCARATHVLLPDGRKLLLQKWAPMGNCLTFPVESLIFWALAQAGIIYETGRKSDQVYVFGDDIIFPTSYYGIVLRSLCSAGLVPNFTKTFRNGFFRESCGVDAFDGVDITPLRMKRANIICAEDAQAFCSLAARLRKRGFEQSCVACYAAVESWLGHRLEIVNDPEASGICEYRNLPLFSLVSMYEGTKTLRFNSNLHRYEVRHLKVSPKVNQGNYQHDRYHALHALVDLYYRSPISDGLQYVIPYSQRSTYGWTEILPIG